MSFPWSEETTLKFVCKYVEHECLWNIKSTHYKNKQMKQSAYLDVENSMNIQGFGEKEIKIKIKNIRSTYLQELKKIKEFKYSGAESDKVYIPSVKWFNLLDASLRNRTSILTQSDSHLTSNSSHIDDTDTESTPLPPSSTKKKEIAQLSKLIEQLKEIAKTTNSTADVNEFNENEFDEVLGKQVRLELKSLPPLLALVTLEHIQLYLNHIIRHHLQNASEENRNTRTPEALHATEPPYNNNLEEQATECLTHHSISSQHESFIQQSMQQIEIVQSATTTPISLLVQSLVKQLCSLLEKDMLRANKLYNIICEKLHSMNLIDDSYSMGEFEVMRSQYQRALYQLLAVANGTEIPITIPATWPIVQPSGLEWSRYYREFEELFFIARGGFGSVFKARHRLDGVEYAVKKVFIKSSNVDTIMNHLAEVKTIASLNHPNIVNYKAAWLEPMIESKLKKKQNTLKMEMDSDDFSAFNSNITSSVHPNIFTSIKTYNSKELTKAQSESDFKISFKNSNSNENDSSNEDSDESDTDDDITLDDNAVCKLLQSKEYENCSRVNLKWATLYIQMSFCQQTLKQWLDDRNTQLTLTRKSSGDLTLQHSDSNDSACLDPVPIDYHYPAAWTNIELLVDMFTQLVKGLHYIHSQGIIHHDIKPSNVFVEQTESGMQVQLGDFGLACPLQKSHNGLARGTPQYAAPEQLDGQCNPKSDMYSLGIILLELVEPFNTDMERVKTITDLQKGQIPATLTANHPKIAHIISKLVQRRPSKRLDTTQLLIELQNLSENKDDTIKTLRDELAAKDDEIAKLKMMLAKFNYQN